MTAIDRWSNAYEEEIDRRDIEIYDIKTKREDLAEQFEELQKQYEERQKAIEEWLKYKNQKRKEEAELLKCEIAATRIQAWWRGVMVRRCLGIYRKKKKKGKDKKGKRGKTK